MKKVLSVLGLIAILGLSTPVLAAPGGPGHGGPGHGGGPAMHAGGPHGGGHRVHAGVHHRAHMAPRHHGGVVVHSGHPRRSHWHGYGHGYWGNPWCNYRLGWCDPYYYPPCRPHAGVYFPVGHAGVTIGF